MGRQIKVARTFTDSNDQPAVQIEFTAEGTKLMADLTQKNIGKILAVVLDDEIIISPRINEAIIDGEVVINGNFSQKEAEELALKLNAGSQPAPIIVVEKNM